MKFSDFRSVTKERSCQEQRRPRMGYFTESGLLCFGRRDGWPRTVKSLHNWRYKPFQRCTEGSAPLELRPNFWPALDGITTRSFGTR
jgi:hypothetical protein